MSNLTIALIVIAVYSVLCSVAMAVAWYGLKDEPAIYLTKDGWHVRSERSRCFTTRSPKLSAGSKQLKRSLKSRIKNPH
ncbi:hypothetical protein UFJFPfSW6_00006 [Pseudomonas phage UFJF_PfSW6]|uniref:Uncharacterized protein n=1 Tax=Pseudomonas phage UFJF_PfSW6 TaxID=3003725 RepID=A0AAF0AEX4_9CAUD|nr:hypothetical protein UFJFPfSW6_00006 [Pseudomonas phage UFJF_PfSW6]